MSLERRVLFAQNNGSNLLAMVGRIDFIHAVLEAINYLVF